MSAKYTFLAWDTPIDNAPLKLALLQLANNADDNGFSFYSISKMALACGMSEKTFQRKIKEMETMGILTVERRANRPSLYSLVGDEMGVTLCRLQESEATESLGGGSESRPAPTESLPVSDRESPDPNSTPKTLPNNTPNNLSPTVKKPKFCPIEYISSLEESCHINIEAYSEWAEFRIEKKKPVTKTTANKHVKLLVKYSFDDQQKIIDKSINASYQGLFDLDTTQPKYANQQTASFDLNDDSFLNEQSFGDKYGV